jgi:hypothetical protein
VIYTDIKMIWESVKQPLRQALLFVYAYVLNWAFGWVAKTIGFEFSEEQKIQLLAFGTPIVWSILSAIDNFLHRKGKELEEEGTKKKPVESLMTKGIARF